MEEELKNFAKKKAKNVSSQAQPQISNATSDTTMPSSNQSRPPGASPKSTPMAVADPGRRGTASQADDTTMSVAGQSGTSLAPANSTTISGTGQRGAAFQTNDTTMFDADQSGTSLAPANSTTISGTGQKGAAFQTNDTTMFGADQSGNSLVPTSGNGTTSSHQSGPSTAIHLEVSNSPQGRFPSRRLGGIVQAKDTPVTNNHRRPGYTDQGEKILAWKPYKQGGKYVIQRADAKDVLMLKNEEDCGPTVRQSCSQGMTSVIDDGIEFLRFVHQRRLYDSLKVSHVVWDTDVKGNQKTLPHIVGAVEYELLPTLDSKVQDIHDGKFQYDYGSFDWKKPPKNMI
ncbi:MAG: hypothetical protein Q9160_004077 [Pyrenula sp. 1 TL-2023]